MTHTAHTMPEESTTPDPLETGRRSIEAFDRSDWDAYLAMWAPDGVWEFSPVTAGLFGAGSVSGHEAIRKFGEELTAPFEDFETTIEEAHDLGNGVTFTVIVQRGRPYGSDSYAQARYGVVATWSDGRIARAASDYDIDEARAAAERLAEERG